MGETASAKWLKIRKLLPDLVAAGAFGEALHFLKLRIGLINAAPLERPFMHASAALLCSHDSTGKVLVIFEDLRIVSYTYLSSLMF